MKIKLKDVKNTLIWIDKNKKLFGIVFSTIVALVSAEVVTEEPIVDHLTAFVQGDSLIKQQKG